MGRCAPPPPHLRRRPPPARYEPPALGPAGKGEAKRRAKRPLLSGARVAAYSGAGDAPQRAVKKKGIHLIVRERSGRTNK